jgi:hypothetical protein
MLPLAAVLMFVTSAFCWLLKLPTFPVPVGAVPGFTGVFVFSSPDPPPKILLKTLPKKEPSTSLSSSAVVSCFAADPRTLLS